MTEPCGKSIGPSPEVVRFCDGPKGHTDDCSPYYVAEHRFTSEPASLRTMCEQLAAVYRVLPSIVLC